MTKRKFTPPTKFPAEYFDGEGGKAVILGRGPDEEFPFIGYDANGYAATWTELGEYRHGWQNEGDLHGMPKHLDEREDWDALQEVTAELEQAVARINELEAELAADRAELIELIRRDEDNGDISHGAAQWVIDTITERTRR